MEQRKAKCVCLLFIAPHLYLFSYATCFCIYLFSTLRLVLLSCVSHHWAVIICWCYSSYTCSAQHGINIMLLNTENEIQRCFIVMCTMETLCYTIYPEIWQTSCQQIQVSSWHADHIKIKIMWGKKVANNPKPSDIVLQRNGPLSYLPDARFHPLSHWKWRQESCPVEESDPTTSASHSKNTHISLLQPHTRLFKRINSFISERCIQGQVSRFPDIWWFGRCSLVAMVAASIFKTSLDQYLLY